MDERRLEIKVGALIVAGLVSLVALFWLMGELSLAQQPSITLQLTHTGNVAHGAPVKLGGVQVGRVESITLQPAHRDAAGQPLPVVMALSLDESVLPSLHADTQVMVATRGLLGESYLELDPGTKDAAPLTFPATLRGVDAPRLDLLTARMAKLMEAAGQTLEEDPAALGQLLSGISKLSNGAGDVLIDNRAQLKVLIDEMGTTARELRTLAQTASAQLQPGGKTAALIDDASASAKVLRKELPGLTGNASRTLAGLSQLTSEFTAEDGQKLRAALTKYSAAGDKLDQLATRGERMLARIEAGEGSVGGLVKDDQLYRDLRDLIADLKAHPWKVVWKQ